MATTSKTSRKKISPAEEIALATSKAVQAQKSPRPEWNAADADAAAATFGKTLTPKMSAKELIAAMKPYVAVAGWKRLVKTADAFFSKA